MRASSMRQSHAFPPAFYDCSVWVPRDNSKESARRNVGWPSAEFCWTFGSTAPLCSKTAHPIVCLLVQGFEAAVATHMSPAFRNCQVRHMAIRQGRHTWARASSSICACMGLPSTSLCSSSRLSASSTCRLQTSQAVDPGTGRPSSASSQQLEC